MVISSFVDDEAAQETGGPFGLPVSISLRFTKGHQADERLAAATSRLRCWQADLQFTHLATLLRWLTADGLSLEAELAGMLELACSGMGARS